MVGESLTGLFALGLTGEAYSTSPDLIGGRFSWSDPG